MRKNFFISMFVFFTFIVNGYCQAEDAPMIVDRPILWTNEREALTREYAVLHYGKTETTIIPQAVVVHWTASNTFHSAYNHFFKPKSSDGELNVASHFIVDRDGIIYRLTSETALNKHIIGYNWCAIGIENVGGVNGNEDLTDEQLKANISLIRYLKDKYPTIRYCFGHYQQLEARKTGLYIENVPDYYARKIDPGKKFMKSLRTFLENDNLIFFEE